MSKDGGIQLVLMGSILLTFFATVCLAAPWKARTLCNVDAVISVMLIIFLFFGYSALYCGEKIRRLRLIGMNSRVVEWEEFMERFTSGMLYTTVLLGLVIGVMLTRMANDLRPTVQSEQHQLAKLAMKELYKVFEDLRAHRHFDAALKQTVKIANTEETVAMKVFVGSVVHRLGDASLATRMDEKLGGRFTQLSHKANP